MSAWLVAHGNKDSEESYMEQQNRETCFNGIRNYIVKDVFITVIYSHEEVGTVIVSWHGESVCNRE